jgi:hypothetical protein
MRMTDGDAGKPCRVIPFERPAKQEDHVTISNIAAVIAVTVLHYKGESPETRLLEIIESSGEAEVFDIADALEEFNEVNQTGPLKHHALNDNEPIKLV